MRLATALFSSELAQASAVADRQDDVAPLPRVTDTFLISDVHLGLPASRVNDLIDVMKSWRFRRLVLLGDIFHDLHFQRLTSDSWDFLGHIRKLSNPRRKVEVIWVLGNHDRQAAKVASHLMGIHVCEMFTWLANERRYMAVHGDRFDRVLSDNPILTDAGAALLSFCQRRLSTQGRWPLWMDRKHAHFMRLSKRVAVRAKRFALENSADVIFCGHTHEATHDRPDPVADGLSMIEYVNTGAWIGSPSHFATVDAAGVTLHKVL